MANRLSHFENMRITDYFRRLRAGEIREKAWLDAGALCSRPPIMDAELMSKADIMRRRIEGRLLHKYGERLLAVSFFGDMPCVMVGNPEQVVKLSK